MLTRGFHDIRWKAAALVIVLVIGLLVSAYHTYLIVHNRQADAAIIDLAGRQRMLMERHMKQVLLASQGFPVDPAATGDLLRERVHVLLNGGSTVLEIGERTVVTLPPAQTSAIATEFREQQERLNAFLAKERAFFELRPGSVEQARARDELLRLNEVFVIEANEGVAVMSEHSESKIDGIIKWDIGVVIVAALCGLFLAAQLLKANRDLQHEIAERQHAQHEALEALKQNDQLKSTLLSSVSHELRTPLTAIHSLISSVEDATGEVRRELVEGVREEVRYLNRLVDNLLDMSRMDAGVLHPRREWHLLEELIEAAIRRFGPALPPTRLHVQLPDTLPPVFVDGTEVQLVLVNLLDNALKFSPPDSTIKLAARMLGDTLEIRVANRGEGIPAEDIARVFDRFYRTQDTINHGIPGTGLGLAICKAVVEAHGGRIEAQSSADETTIVLRLPLVPAPAVDTFTAAPRS